MEEKDNDKHNVQEYSEFWQQVVEEKEEEIKWLKM